MAMLYMTPTNNTSWAESKERKERLQWSTQGASNYRKEGWVNMQLDKCLIYDGKYMVLICHPNNKKVIRTWVLLDGCSKGIYLRAAIKENWSFTGSTSLTTKTLNGEASYKSNVIEALWNVKQQKMFHVD